MDYLKDYFTLTKKYVFLRSMLECNWEKYWLPWYNFIFILAHFESPFCIFLSIVLLCLHVKVSLSLD